MEIASKAASRDLTARVIEKLPSPTDGRNQYFVSDGRVSGLRVRITKAGSKAFVFEAKLQGRTIRQTIGATSAWTLEDARKEARRLATVVDTGADPREVKRRRQRMERGQLVTVGEVWARYQVEGRPKRRDDWKPSYRKSMQLAASPGGEKKRRGTGLTRPGSLYPLMKLTLVQLTEDRLVEWFDAEAKRSRYQASRAFNMLRGLLRWCSARPEYRGLISQDLRYIPAITENMPPLKRRTDALEAYQVRPWWESVGRSENPVVGAYLQALLLTGARRSELASLTWENIDLKWGTLTIADKVELTRTIPLGPYLAGLLMAISQPDAETGKRHGYVFRSETAANGHLSEARKTMNRAIREVGIERLTLHGLRRSFSLLAEASGAPSGAIAQVMGHKPSGVAEGYRPRSMTALRAYMLSIESSIIALVQAPVQELLPVNVTPISLAA